MRDTNVDKLLEHVESMINTLEYDSMRSPGKTKLNAGVLVSLCALKDIYEAEAKKKPAPKKD